MSEGDVPLPGDNDSSGDKSKRVGSKRALSDPLLAVAPEDEEHVVREIRDRFCWQRRGFF